MEQEELFNALTRFHREIARPDFERMIDERINPLRDEMLTNFDAVFTRLERLEHEDQMQLEAMRRMDGRLTGVEGRLTGVETRLTGVEHRLTNVEHGLVEVRHDIAELRKERA